MIVGIVGGGQLARMLALAGHPLGLRFIFLDPAPDACAAPLGEHLCGGFDDRDCLQQLADRCDVVTYEFENVPEESIAFLAERVPVHPGAEALAVARDRLREKSLFRNLGIPTAPFAAVDSREDLGRAVTDIGLPAVLKTRTLGYDGKGQAVMRQPEDLDTAWAELGGVPLILEGFVPFEREASIIAVRSPGGETAFYPLSENTHRNGILHLSLSRPGDPLQAEAESSAKRLLESLDYVGVLALELFQLGDTLLANEMAPRVHNSGHWTIEGAEISQFENHLRAILGLPLGSTEAVGRSAMLNFIGEVPEAARALSHPAVHLHVYGKAPRPGRKVGHATLRAPDEQALQGRLGKLLALVDRPAGEVDEPRGSTNPDTPIEESTPAVFAH